LPNEGRNSPLHEQYLENSLLDSEDYDIDCDLHDCAKKPRDAPFAGPPVLSPSRQS
jgi:hypothetical protein